MITKTKRKFLLALIMVSVIIATFLAGMAIGISADGGTPSLYIDMYNLSFRDNMAIKYAVRKEGNITGEVRMLVWTEEQVKTFSSEDNYVLGTQSQTLTTVGYQTINSVTYDIFDLTGITAKQMTDVFYARAVLKQDNTVYYSAVAKYSVAQYAHDIRETGSSNLLVLVDDMLAYGAAAQKHFNYKADWLATDTSYKINIVGGKLSDGTTSGFYKAGTTISAAPVPSTGQMFSHWENSAGQEVTALTVTKDDTFTAVFVQGDNQGLTYTLNDDKESYTVSDIGTCTDTDIVIPPTFNDKPVTGIGDYVFYVGYNSSAIVLPSDNFENDEYRDCSNMTSIVIPGSVTRIGAYAFSGCSSLTTITFNGTMAQWHNISKGVHWNNSTGTYTIHCTDGDIPKE